MKRFLQAAAILAFPAAMMAASTTAKVEQGVLKGTREGALTVYRGLPFAAPPIGDLRWRPPQPPAKWQGVRPADKFAPECVQILGGGPDGTKPPAMSEDCLYLNVWTPAKSTHDRIPVLVWIYGGGFNAGATSVPTYSGEVLARKGVVLVSIAYRVGPFGFLAHPELSAESAHHVSGNYGLLDMIAALQWIKANIAAFGGDPNKVTIFGESAGGIAVSQLCASPLAKGLFEGAISESGGSFGPPRRAGQPGENMRLLADAERDGVALARDAGASSIDELRKMPAEKIMAAQRTRGLAWPIIDGWVIPADQYTMYEQKQFNVDLLLGSNSQELQRPFFPMSGGLREAISEQYGPLASKALALYELAGTREPAPDPELGAVMAQWATDTQFRCGSVAELAWHTAAGNVGYQFQFSHSAPGKEALGAGHGSEVAYVFGDPGTGQPPRSFDSTDWRVSHEMQDYWTNFAKSGDPNDGKLPQWPKFDPKARAYIDFTNSGPVAKEGLRRQVCELYSQYLEGRMKQ